MRKIRKNNDILVEVSVKRDGYPENLAGKDVHLSMKVAYINIPVRDFTINGNVISFTFPASAQKHVGVYSLTIQVNSGDATNTVDKCDIFELVGCSCQISGEDDPNIKTESVSLGLDVYLDAGGSGTGGGGGGEGTSDYNNLENKPTINGVTLQGEKTLEQLGIQPAGKYLTEENDPKVPDWAKQEKKPLYTASEVGAIATGGVKTINGKSIEGQGDLKITSGEIITEEDGFHIADATGKDVMNYTADGFDVAKVSDHFVQVLSQAGVTGSLEYDIINERIYNF